MNCQRTITAVAFASPSRREALWGALLVSGVAMRSPARFAGTLQAHEVVLSGTLVPALSLSQFMSHRTVLNAEPSKLSRRSTRQRTAKSLGEGRMRDSNHLREQTPRRRALAKTAIEPELIGRLPVWSAEPADEADPVERRAAENIEMTVPQCSTAHFCNAEYDFGTLDATGPWCGNATSLRP